MVTHSLTLDVIVVIWLGKTGMAYGISLLIITVIFEQSDGRGLDAGLPKKNLGVVIFRKLNWESRIRDMVSRHKQLDNYADRRLE